MPRELNPLVRRRAVWPALLPLLGLTFAVPASAAVVISQVYGGGGNSGAPFNSDFVELHNTGPGAVAIDGWSVQYASAAGSTWGGGQLTPLSGSIPAGGYFLVQLASGANGAALPPPNTTGATALSATAGKVALVANATALSGACPIGAAELIDFVGYGAGASCSETAPAPAPSNTTSVIRASVGNSCVDTGNNSADFAALPPLPRNSASPAQPCRGSGGVVVTPPMVAKIFEIQGSGAQSPLATKLVTTAGVVTKLNNNGFFIQDLTGDGDAATSDGIFVFANPATYPAVAVGNLVRVTATVTEFNTGATPTAATPTPTLTELTAVSAVTLEGTGYTLSPVAVQLPEAAEGDLERYEGMLVTLTGPFTIGQNFFQGRYGQLTLGFNGRLETPTNRHRPGTPEALALADENARRRILLDDGNSLQNPNPTPYLDAATALPRAGDTVGSITGVIDFGLATNNNPGPGDYRISPTVAPVFATGNPRTSAPPAVGGNVKVASFNVLNFFTTFTNGTTAGGLANQGCSLGGQVADGNCRGANNLDEFLRQRAKIVEAMAAIDADALGLIEIQNNGNEAVQNLVDALNARVGAGTYAAAALPAQSTGTDAIRVAVIYKPAKLVAVGAPVSDPDPVNNRPTLAQTFSTRGERFTLVVNHFKSKGSCPEPGDADAAGNLDSGDGQGCWNAQRVQQAERLRTFLAGVQATSGTDKVLVMGDLNAYAQEDPIFALTRNGYVDQVERFSRDLRFDFLERFVRRHPRPAYSYVFDGEAGRLDHAISSRALALRVSGATVWHINADEIALADYNREFKSPALCSGSPCPADPYQPTAYRSSDHDPVVVGLRLFAIPRLRDECRGNGWLERFREDGSGFRNLGDCIQFVNTGK